MDEEFQFARNRLADGTHLGEGQFPLEHEPGEAHRLVAPGLFRRPDGALGGSVQAERAVRSGELRDRQVLDDQPVGAGRRQRPDQSPGFRQLFFI